MNGPSEIEPGRSLYAHELDSWLLDALSILSGDNVLELASGFGDLCLRLAERVRPGGSAICSDIRPPRVAETARRAGDAGASDVSTRVIDMLRIELPDKSVDGILCRWGYMFPLPTEVAFAEALRVLRPRRRISLAVWGDPARNPWMSLIDATMLAEGYTMPTSRSVPGGMVSLADPQRLRGLLRGAGFEDVELAEVPVAFEYADSDSHWNEEARYAGGPFTEYLDRLPGAPLADIRARLDAAIAPFRSPTGAYRIPGLAIGATGRRP